MNNFKHFKIEIKDFWGSRTIAVRLSGYRNNISVVAKEPPDAS